MNVPILDDAYMQRRAEERARRARIDGWAAESLYMRAHFGATRSTDPVEDLREKYATGSITFEQFEERLERVL